MSTLVTYKEIDGGNVQEVSPDPVTPALGGLALNTNFRAIADSLPRNNYGASTNPTPDNDSVDTAGIGVDFSKGSRWYNGTAIFECVDPTPTAAVWVQVNAGGTTPTLEAVTTAGATTDQQLSLSGGVNLVGSGLNGNTGSGAGGGTWKLDSGVLQLDSNASISGDGSGKVTLSGVANQANLWLSCGGGSLIGQLNILAPTYVPGSSLDKSQSSINFEDQTGRATSSGTPSGGTTITTSSGTTGRRPQCYLH